MLFRSHNNWGLCNFPEGKAYYEAVVSADTGCDDSVEDLFSQIAKARREDLTFCQNLLEKNPKLASQSPKPDAALKEENAMLSRLQKEILTDFPAPPQTEVEICHVDPALSEYLAPAFYITAPIDDISHNRIYINDAKNDTDIYYFTTLAHEGYPGHLYQTICRHALCTRKGRTVYDDSHRKPRNAGVKIAERILFHVSGNKEVAMWMDNLKRRKERYYRDNLEVILRIIPGYDKNTLIEAIRMCLDKGIYNGDSVKSLCEIGRASCRERV